MQHKIRVAFVGDSGLLTSLVTAVLRENVIPPENIFISEKTLADKQIFNEKAICFCPEDMDVVIKGEIVVICGDNKSELSADLAPISGCTQGRVLIAVCKDLNCDYVLERVPVGTIVMVVRPTQNTDDGKISAELEFANGFPPYLRTPCEDIVGSLFNYKS